MEGNNVDDKVDDDGADNWLPLESNPEVINNFIRDLGFDISKYCFHEMLSVEPWAQEMIPQPVQAVVFLYPINDKQEDFANKEEQEIKTKGQTVSSNLFFMKQYAGNACGTIAAFHSMINMAQDTADLIQKDSFLDKFIIDTKGMNSQEKGKFFQNSKYLKTAHKEAVEDGDTSVEESVNTHFIAFVEKEGSLYELDGRKEFAINHGPCTKAELLSKACGVIQKFMERDPEEIKFTLMAIGTPAVE